MRTEMKVDYKKEFKYLYTASRKNVAIVDVPPQNYLMIDGMGDPNTSPDYQAALEALFGMAYIVKFHLKKLGVEPDFTVMPLEGLWWMNDPGGFNLNDKDNWLWTTMIFQSPHVSDEHIEEATEQLRKKKNPSALPKLRFESYHEGPSVQIMHVGPYDEEGPAVEQIHSFILESGHRPHMKHHEIYLSDPRRADPGKLKTILRQPMTEV